MPITAAQKAAIEDVVKSLLSLHAPKGRRLLCGMFMELVDREEWPQYYEVIPEPRCLNNITAGVDKGRYKEASDVYTDLSLVFWNAIFYNEPGSQIALDAQTLKNALEDAWRKKPVLPHPRSSPPRSSAQKVHGVVDKAESAPANPALQAQRRQTTPLQSSTVAHNAGESPATRNTTQSAKILAAGTSNATAAVTATMATTTYAKPVPIRPKAAQKQATPDMEVDILSGDDGLGEDMAVERDPESEEIVKQLEKGLPRWPGFGEQGWMQEASPDRILELVQTVKNHKDIVGNRLAVALEAVPEESTIPHLSYTTPLSLKLIESRARHKKYENAKEFDKEMARLFETARRWHTPCSESYGHILLLQRLYQALTSPNPPPGPPFVSTTHFAALRAGPGTTKPVHGSDTDGVAGVTTHRVLTRDRKFVDEVHHKGWTLKLADWVHLSNPDDPARPIIAQVFRCWISEEPTKVGQPGITVSWYYRPEQTFHPADRKFWEGEVFKTSHFADHPIEDIIEKIACQFTARHIRGRPRPPYWYPGFPLYVCDSRYNDRDRIFVKIKNWNSCIPEEVRKSTEFMPIYPFERTVYPIQHISPFLVKGNKVKGPGGIVPSAPGEANKIEGEKKRIAEADPAGSSKNAQGSSSTHVTTTSATTQISRSPYYQQTTQQTVPQVQQTYRPPGPDKSVYTAAGGTALGSNIQIEKIPPETTKHFDRDPHTNEMLWFAAPPLNMPRPPRAKHSLAYLHFLAMKTKKHGENGSEHGADDEDEDDDGTGSMSPAKRIKLEAWPTVSETMKKVWTEMNMDI